MKANNMEEVFKAIKTLGVILLLLAVSLIFSTAFTALAVTPFLILNLDVPEVYYEVIMVLSTIFSAAFLFVEYVVSKYF